MKAIHEGDYCRMTPGEEKARHAKHTSLSSPKYPNDYFARLEHDDSCNAGITNEEEAERIANIHLIAAAPELLESLIALRDMFVESHQAEIDSGHGGDEDCSYCEAIEQANKAIQKATGEA